MFFFWAKPLFHGQLGDHGKIYDYKRCLFFVVVSDFFYGKIFHGHLADHGKKPGKISLQIKDVSAAKQMFKGSHGKGV